MENIDYKKVAEALDQFLTQNPDSKHLVLGEDHRDGITNCKLLSNPHIVSVLHKHGLTTTAIERPEVFQEHIDKIMYNDQSPEEFKESIIKEYESIGVSREELGDLSPALYKSIGELTETQTKLGSVVVFFDNPDSSLEERDQQSVAATRYEKEAGDLAYKKFCSKEIQDMANKYFGIEGYSDEGMARFKSMIMGKELVNEGSPANEKHEQFKALRINERDEALRADHIKNNTTDGSVVLAGSWHGSGFNDLDEKLGAARICIVPNMEEYYKRSQLDFNTGNEAPEGYLILETGEIIDGQEAYSQAQEFEAYVAEIVNDTDQTMEGPIASAQAEARQAPMM